MERSYELTFHFAWMQFPSNSSVNSYSNDLQMLNEGMKYLDVSFYHNNVDCIKHKVSVPLM